VTDAARIADDVRAVVLVEGLSDRVAIEALADRRGRDLAAEGVSVVPIGGAQAIRGALAVYGPAGLDLALAGLCDVGEERSYRRGLEHAGLGRDLTREDLERLGFYVCEADLEDELIRALEKQPEWRSRPLHDQLRRFFGSGGRRKIRYARFLVDALELERVPRPLDGVLAHV
jgi:hypothetical protein